MFKSFKQFFGLKIIRDSYRVSLKRFKTINTNSDSSKEVTSFTRVLQDRHDQADRTVLIKVNSPNDCYELYDHLNKIGTVKIIYHYFTQEHLQFALVEMAEKKSVRDIFKEAVMMEGMIGMQTLNFFSFQPNASRKMKVGSENLDDVVLLKSPTRPAIDTVDLNTFKDLNLLNEKLFILAEQSKINDLNCRLRFLTAKQLENIVKAINPTIKVLPIGNSVNGFGSNKNDLELVALAKLNTKESGLKFHMKTMNNVHTHHLEIIQELISNFLPGCQIDGNQKLNTEKPGLNFTNQFTSLDCNLTLYDSKLLVWTELLYLISLSDYRIKLLACLIQQWGSRMSLTKNLVYDRCLSDDTLILLLLFFLQQKHFKYPSLLPALTKINPDRLQLLTELKCSQVLTSLRKQAESNELLVKELYFLFFRYYSKFDFEKYGLSLRTGQLVPKADSCFDSLVVENPFYKDENVCKDVTSKNLKRLQECFRDTFDKLFVIFKEELSAERRNVN